MKFNFGFLKYILLLIPAAFGFYGFLQIDGITATWALYYTIRLFSLNTDVTEINLWIEVARWTAPLATAGILAMIFQSFKNYLVNFIRELRKQSCTVYGDGQAARCLLNSLGKCGVEGKLNRVSNTSYQVILFDDEEKNLDFYNKFEEKLLKNKTYISLNDIHVKKTYKKGVVPFSMIDNNASVYWDNYPADINERIAIIGNSYLTDCLLTKGILLNIYSKNQHIEYNIFKTNNDYNYIHTELNKITLDRINFYSTNWYENFELLSKMNRIILCDEIDKNNLKILSKLTTYMVHPLIYINVKSSDLIDRFFDVKNVISFGMLDGLATRDMIINEKLIEDAKNIHNNYVDKNGGSAWDDLSEFTKGSNISSASFRKVMNKLRSNNIDEEEMAELEHIRWCRYHYLYNWKYGNIRNDELKEHNDLIDYSVLSEMEKQKDRDNIDLMKSNEVTI